MPAELLRADLGIADVTGALIETDLIKAAPAKLARMPTGVRGHARTSGAGDHCAYQFGAGSAAVGATARGRSALARKAPNRRGLRRDPNASQC